MRTSRTLETLVAISQSFHIQMSFLRSFSFSFLYFQFMVIYSLNCCFFRSRSFEYFCVKSLDFVSRFLCLFSNRKSKCDHNSCHHSEYFWIYSDEKMSELQGSSVNHSSRPNKTVSHVQCLPNNLKCLLFYRRRNVNVNCPSNIHDVTSQLCPSHCQNSSKTKRNEMTSTAVTTTTMTL